MPNSIAELLAKLRSLEIEIKLDGEKFSVSAPKGALTPDIQNEIRVNKSDIIAALGSPKPGTTGGGLSFWQKLLANSAAEIEIAFDRPRGLTTPQFDKVIDTLSRQECDNLRKVAENLLLAEDIILFAAFQITVARLASHYDVISGFMSDTTTQITSRTPGVSHANATGVEHSLQLPLPVRTDLSENPSISTAINTVASAVSASVTNFTPELKQFLEAVQASRSVSNLPAFQTSFRHTRNKAEDVAQPHNASESELISGSDIRLITTSTDNEIQLDLRYNSAIQEQSTAKLFLTRFRMVLAAIAEKMNVGILEFPIVTDEERDLILVDWNYTAPTGWDFNRCVGDLISEQAKITPDKTAITDGIRSLTYRELELETNKLANHLIAVGVNPGSKVGICVERSPNIVISALAIWKAGAAYVPLDPTYPKDRLIYMAEDSSLEALITEESLVSLIDLDESKTQGTGPRLVFLNKDADAINAQPETPPAIQRSPEDLAYIIYTSGSTGRPKGVMIRHLGVVNQILGLRETTGFKSTDNFFSVSAPSFDVSVAEYYMPLVTGGTVTIAPFSLAADGTRLKSLMAQSNPTFMQATPALWRLILDAGWNDGRGMTIYSAGEPLTKELAVSLLSTGASLWNLYGPTEITIYSHGCKVPHNADRIYIGRSLINYTGYILNEAGELAPPNVLGEIFLGGVGVAIGYQNRENLTEERFIKDPFSQDPNARMYKTGDQGRFNTNGEVDCTGRLDNQVKIRGFRIELGEIESQLALDPTVKEAVVIVREDSPGDKRLVAYVQSVPGQSTKIESLKEKLTQQLPPYMVPALFVTMESFPMTPSGKIDRRNLPAPKIQRNTGIQFVAPTLGLESEIASIWKHVLKVDKVGSNENFFDLGGDSLLAARLQIEIQQKYSVGFPLVELFRSPTVSSVTKFVARTIGVDTADNANKRSFTSRARERAMLQNRNRPKH